ncbi:MAG: methionyl-tRNA formyltransferase [Alphaproteobacteria bacterium]|nr:methionyl-tRNA formyltransferase [Alphaproteobacteria bacterium]
MKTVFIGSVIFSRTVLAALAAQPDVEITGVVTRRAAPASGDFASLRDDAATLGAPCLEADDTDNAALAAWIRDHAPDALFCIGWNRLLTGEVLAIAPKGTIGYHPAALPENRGRHPIIWALALGLSETASTFFLMDEGADTGAIVDQEPVPIGADDDAGSLYARLQDVASDQITRFVPRLADGTLAPRPQDPQAGNSWRKRGPEDGRIDWRMPAQSIRNLVRALAAPYPGATCLVGGHDVVVRRAEIVADAPRNLEPGKVLSVEGKSLVVKCGGGAVRLTEHDIDPLPEPGAYL